MINIRDPNTAGSRFVMIECIWVSSLNKLPQGWARTSHLLPFSASVLSSPFHFFASAHGALVTEC